MKVWLHARSWYYGLHYLGTDDEVGQHAKYSERALAMTKTSADLQLKLGEADAQKLAASYGNIAMFAIETGDYEQSLRYSAACLEIRMRDEQGQIVNISSVYTYYAWCYLLKDELDTAEDYLQKSRDVLEGAFGLEGAKKRPQYTWMLTARAALHLKLGREADAEADDKQAFRLNTAIYGPLSPRIFVSWYKSARWDVRRGRSNKARGSVKRLIAEMEKGGFPEEVRSRLYISEEFRARGWFFKEHRAKAYYLLSKVYENCGLLSRSQETLAKAIKLGEERWNKEGFYTGKEEDFDNLVFFHDR